MIVYDQEFMYDWCATNMLSKRQRERSTFYGSLFQWMDQSQIVRVNHVGVYDLHEEG
jgi:hypothetical protein